MAEKIRANFAAEVNSSLFSEHFRDFRFSLIDIFVICGSIQLLLKAETRYFAQRNVIADRSVWPETTKHCFSFEVKHSFSLRQRPVSCDILNI